MPKYHSVTPVETQVVVNDWSRPRALVFGGVPPHLCFIHSHVPIGRDAPQLSCDWSAQTRMDSRMRAENLSHKNTLMRDR